MQPRGAAGMRGLGSPHVEDEVGGAEPQDKPRGWQLGDSRGTQRKDGHLGRADGCEPGWPGGCEQGAG